MRLIAGLVVAAAVAVAAAPARTTAQEVTYTTWADCTPDTDEVQDYDAVYNGRQHQAEQTATRYERNGCDTYITFWPDWVQ